MLDGTKTWMAFWSLQTLKNNIKPWTGYRILTCSVGQCTQIVQIKE